MIYIGFESIGMDLGQLLLMISAVAFLLEALFVVLGEYIEKWEVYSDLSLIVGSSALIISFFYFSFSIISADYAFMYVSNNINNNMDIILRISVIWSGQEGSYFFWAFLAVIFYLIFRRLFQNAIHETIFWRSFVLMAIQVMILVILTIMSDPFKLNTEIMADGMGLNPLLLTYWNVIHPPIILLGYALCLVPMVIGIARISVLEEGKVPSFDEKEKLDKFFEFMVSLAWLVLSSGIIIGGYWAYITLGWGGFWAWDPVETASLIPWLFLTLYYHGKAFHSKSQYLGNYIISMTYIGALFATYLTRSAIISSVHTFEPEGSLEKIFAFFPENIINIILRFMPDERTLVLFVFIVGIFLVPHILGIKNKELTRIRISVQKADFQVAKSQSTALKISYIAFFIGTYVMILGLITPVIYDIIGYILTVPFLYEFYSFLQEGSNNILPLVSRQDGFLSSISIDQIFYNTMLTLFGGIMLLAQFFCTYYPRFSIKRKFGLMISGVIVGILFTLSGFLYRNGDLKIILGQGNPILSFLGNFWTTSDKANLVIPLLLLGMIGLLVEFINVALKEEKHLIRKTSQIMLHFSFLIILLGALLSANMTITEELELVQVSGVYEIPGTSLSIEILDLDEIRPDSGLHSVEYETQFKLYSGDRIIGFGANRLSLDRRPEAFGGPRQDPEVTIISDLFSDIYIVTTGAWVSQLTGSFVASDLQIKIIPYINILWFGCILLHFAIIPLTIGRFILLREVFLSGKGEQDKKVVITGPTEQKEPDISGDANG